MINENGRFTKPREGLTRGIMDKAWAKYDNDLFQTGRLITCGLYMVLGHPLFSLHAYLDLLEYHPA